MKKTTVFAVAALSTTVAATTLAHSPAYAVDLERDNAYEDCRGYVMAPSSVSQNSARAAIVASNSLLHPNVHRQHFGPHFYTRFYNPVLACKILRAKAAKRRTRR